MVLVFSYKPMVSPSLVNRLKLVICEWPGGKKVSRLCKIGGGRLSIICLTHCELVQIDSVATM